MDQQYVDSEGGQSQNKGDESERSDGGLQGSEAEGENQEKGSSPKTPSISASPSVISAFPALLTIWRKGWGIHAKIGISIWRRNRS